MPRSTWMSTNADALTQRSRDRRISAKARPPTTEIAIDATATRTISQMPPSNRCFWSHTGPNEMSAITGSAPCGQVTFEQPRATRRHERHGDDDDGGRGVQLERAERVERDRSGDVEHVDQTDHRHDRRPFEQGDQHVDRRRQHHACGLREDHRAERGRRAEADGQRGLSLAGVDRLQRAPVVLGHVPRPGEPEGEDARPELAEHEPMAARRGVVQPVQEDEQRDPAHDRDPQCGGAVQQRRPRHPQHRHGQPHRGGDDERHDGDLQGQPEAVEQLATMVPDGRPPEVVGEDHR